MQVVQVHPLVSNWTTMFSSFFTASCYLLRLPISVPLFQNIFVQNTRVFLQVENVTFWMVKLDFFIFTASYILLHSPYIVFRNVMYSLPCISPSWMHFSELQNYNLFCVFSRISCKLLRRRSLSSPSLLTSQSSPLTIYFILLFSDPPLSWISSEKKRLQTIWQWKWIQRSFWNVK